MKEAKLRNLICKSINNQMELYAPMNRASYINSCNHQTNLF